MAQTGKERSLTVKITKKIADVIQPGYPITYQGRQAFTHLSVTWPEITVDYMSIMLLDDYNARLTAFKSYVESRESGLSFSTDTIEGNEAYRDNTTSCPILTI